MTEILIYGEIGIETTAAYVAAELEAAGGADVHVRFNSPGGIGSDGIAIYNRLKEYPGTVTGTIDGLAASAAVIAAMGCDRLEMASNAFLMIHNSWVDMAGNARELDQRSKGLKKFDEHQAHIYAEKTGMDLEQVHALMEQEEELDAQQALSLGLIDAVTGESRIAANLNRERIMARAKATKKPAAKKAAAKRPVPKKPASKKARTRSVSVELDEEDDDPMVEEDEEMLMDPDEELAEGDEEEMAEGDEEMCEDEDEPMAEDDEDPLAEDDEETAVRAASYRQIVKACAGINPKASGDAKFIARVQAKELSVNQARSAWMRELVARNGRSAGVDPVRTTQAKTRTSGGGNAVARFNAAVRERMRVAKCNRREATMMVAKSDRDLHKAFLLETNQGRRQRELIQDRFRN